MALYHFCLLRMRLRRNGLCICLSITCRPRVGTADDKSLACLGTGRRILYDDRMIGFSMSIVLTNVERLKAVDFVIVLTLLTIAAS